MALAPPSIGRAAATRGAASHPHPPADAKSTTVTLVGACPQRDNARHMGRGGKWQHRLVRKRDGVGPKKE